MPRRTAQILLAAAAIPFNSTGLKTHFAELGNQFSNMSDSDLRDYLNPNPADYVLVPFRALSAADDVQHGMFNFAHDGGAALKAAVGMFNDLMVLKDHDMSVDNWVGKTQEAYWDTSIPNSPPGVNFMIKLDTKADPKLARGVLSGMVNSGSVTIEFDYDQSHPKMKDYEFYMNLGQVVEGKRVQALITKVTRLYEYSLVWQGADTHAKAIKPDGTIDRPGLGQNTEDGNLKKLAALLKLADTATEDEIAASLTVLSTNLANAEAAKTTAEAEKTAAQATLATKEAELATKTTEVTSLNAKVVTLTSEKTAAEAELNGLKATKTQFETLLAARRAEALRLYNLANGDKASESMRTVIGAAPLDTTESFITAFGAEVEKIMPLTCAKCASTEVNRRQSKQAPSGTTEGEGKGSEGKETFESKRLKSVVTSIHGE